MDQDTYTSPQLPVWERRQGDWVEPAWRASYGLAAAGLVYGFLRVPLAQQACAALPLAVLP